MNGDLSDLWLKSNTKVLFSHTLLCDSSLFSDLKEWRQYKQ